jgi:hypothetical protein
MYVQDKQSAIQMLDYSVTDYVWRVGRLKKQWTAQRLTKIRDEHFVYTGCRCRSILSFNIAETKKVLKVRESN